MNKKLSNARNKVYSLFLQKDTNRVGSGRERAEIFALVGDFPRAFEFVKEIKEASVRKPMLYRMISALRRSFERPHEVEEVKHLGDFELLLWREYFDAARMWASFEDKYHRWQYYLQIYEKTSWPQDVEEARKSARHKKELGAVRAWLEIAQGTRRLEDIVELDRCLENARWAEKSNKATMAIYLAGRHELDSTGNHLKRAIALANRLSDPGSCTCLGPIDVWRAICHAHNSKQNQAELRRAERRFARLKRLWAREEERNARLIRLREKDEDKKRVGVNLQNPSHCLHVARKRRSLWYLNRALSLLETYDGSNRTRLLLEAIDLIDEWRKREVLERRYYSPPEQLPPPLPDLLRNRTLPEWERTV